MIFLFLDLRILLEHNAKPIKNVKYILKYTKTNVRECTIQKKFTTCYTIVFLLQLLLFNFYLFFTLSLSLSLSQIKDGVGWGCVTVEHDLRWWCFDQRWWQRWVQSWGEAPLQFNSLLFSSILNRMDDMWHMVNQTVINKIKSRTNFLTFFLSHSLSHNFSTSTTPGSAIPTPKLEN